MYHKELNDISVLNLPPATNSDKNYFDIYQNYEIEIEKRDKLKNYLADKGVGTLIQWGGKAVHQWNGLGFQQSIPNVERFFEECIMLPMNTFISDDDVYYTCNKIKEFYQLKA